MRILFSFVGGNGHFQPLVPIARAAETAGHTIACTGEPSMTAVVEDTGFRAVPTGPNLAATQRRPLLELDQEREDQVLREGFARRTARARAIDLLDLCADWRPDLVVCDEVDFGAMIAAERLGLPYASVTVIAAGSFVRRELVAEPLNELRAEHGLPPDPDLAMLSRHLVLSPVPPSYRDPAFPLPGTAHTIRALDRSPGPVDPPWKVSLPGAPTVYFTLGTIFNLECGDLFDRVLSGLRDLPVNVVVTVGRDIDPDEFGTQPENVHIERYIPLSSVLPHSDLVVSHGGSGTVLGALAYGLPLVLIPMGADQAQNADRCAALGVGRALDAIHATSEDVRATVSTVLSDPTCQWSARRLRDEIAAQPGPEHAVTLLEKLAGRAT